MGEPTPSIPLPQPFGRYVLQDLLGEGGFARVYRAELQGPAGFRKTVAIKLMRDIHRERAMEIIHEGRIGGLLKHRNVVDTYELGMVRDQGFVAMEWVDGLSLKELLADRVPPSVVLEIGLGICRGLAYAHGLQSSDGSLGLVHMDLKPANVLIGWDGSVKVADFGIARLTRLPGVDPHTSVGTPAYLSPEQTCRQPVDARSDIFALGAVLYELATGEHLFSSDPALSGAARVSHIQETLSQGLDAAETALPGITPVLTACLATAPIDRPDSALALADKLRALRATVGTEPILEVWLASILGDKERRWVADVDSWNSGVAEETLDYSAPDEHGFTDALAALDQSTTRDSAIAALHRAEKCLHGLSIAERTQLDAHLRTSLARAGLEIIAPGNHPYLVFDPDKGGTWSAGVQVANYRVASMRGRLLYNIAVHGTDWSREQLYSEVWEQTYRLPSSDAAMRMAVSRLRSQLKGSGIGVERLGDGQYALTDRPAVVCWRGEPVAVDTDPSGALDPAPLAPPPAPKIRTNLGPEPNAFVGRQSELAALAEQFSEEERLVTILGPPGTGKTRFMRRFATLQVEAGDSAWFCDLTEARTAAGVLSAVATALGVPLTSNTTDEGELAKRLGHAIAARGRTWLLLDNAEQVTEFVSHWTKIWWEQAHEARFVITSRVPLHFKLERRLTLSPLSLPTADTPLEALAENEAVSLFLARARAVRSSFALDRDNASDIIAIVQELDGLPLAIELAAARSNLWPVKTLRSRLSDRFRLLSRPQASLPRRQATLRGALDWSWELLTPWEQAALAQCSVFRDGFTWEAAEAVIDLSPWPDAPWTVDVVGALVEHSLLTACVDAAAESRLSMLVSVAEYGAEKLADYGDEFVLELERRHGLHHGGFGSEEHLASLKAHGGLERRRRLHVDRENFVVATQRALTVGWVDVAANNCMAALKVLDTTGPFDGGVALGEATLTLELAPAVRARLLRAVGQLEEKMGRTDRARSHYLKALEIHRASESQRGECLSLCDVSYLETKGGKTEDVRQNMDAALELSKALGEARVEARVHLVLGFSHALKGETQEALDHYGKTHSIHQALGNRLEEGKALSNLGNLHRQMGRLDIALDHYNRALAIHLEAQNRRSEAIVRVNIAIIHSNQGRYQDSLRENMEGLSIYREIGDRRGEGMILCNLTDDLVREGRPEEALEHTLTALKITREIGYRLLEGAVLSNLANLHKDAGRFDEALTIYREALDIHRDINSHRFEGLIHSEIAFLVAKQGDIPTSREHLTLGEGLLRDANARLELSLLLCIRGHVDLLDGNPTSARACLAEAEATATDLVIPADSELGEALQRLRDDILSSP